MQKIFLLFCLLLGSCFLGHSQDTISSGSNKYAMGDLPPMSKNKVEKARNNSFRVALALGYAARIAQTVNLSPAENEIQDKLMSGFSWNADFQYFFNKRNGIGLYVTGVHTSGSTKGYEYYDIRSKQSFIFMGPGYAFKIDSKYVLFSGGASLGPIFFSEEYTEDYHPNSYTDRISEVGFGINLGFGAEYKVSKLLGVGAKVSLTLGSYTYSNSYDYGYGYEGSSISLSSIMLGGYISFRSR